jgi:rubrerythrin
MSAFAGESQANRKYLAFAKKAQDEGYPQIAKLFKAAAEAETTHAMNHLQRAAQIKSTAENIQAAINGETFEFINMYPEYIKIAKAEGNKDAVWTFNVANKVEQIHAGLYKKAADALANKKDLPAGDLYVCCNCGNTVEGSAPDICPICGSARNAFFKV